MNQQTFLNQPLDGSQIVFQKGDMVRSTQIRYNPITGCLEAGTDRLEDIQKTADWFNIFTSTSQRSLK